MESQIYRCFFSVWTNIAGTIREAERMHKIRAESMDEAREKVVLRLNRHQTQGSIESWKYWYTRWDKADQS